jgi:hypothetical protein
VASCRCFPATFGRAYRYDYQEGRSRTRRRLSCQLDLRTTERQRQEVEDLEDYILVRPRRCRTQARSRRTGAQRSRASARVQRSFALLQTDRKPVSSNGNLSQNLTLPRAGQGTTIKVEASGAEFNATDAQQATTRSELEVDNLPVAGRDLTDKSVEAWTAPGPQKVGAAQSGLSRFPPLPNNLAPEESDARGSHPFLARSRGRNSHGRVFEA